MAKKFEPAMGDAERMARIRNHVLEIEKIEEAIADHKGIIKDLNERREECLDAIKKIAHDTQATLDFTGGKTCCKCGEIKPSAQMANDELCGDCYAAPEKA